MHAQRNRCPSPTDRRTRILGALEDGEYRLISIAAWAELSSQQARADLKWLAHHGFVTASESEAVDGRWYPRWAITDAGRDYLAGLTDEEKQW